MRPSLRIAAAAASLIALLAPGCAGPCRTVQAERRALQARPAVLTAAPHARVQLPFAVANRLIADALVPPPELPVPLRKLGPLAAFIGEVRAIPREVKLGPGAVPGRVHAEVRVELADRTGELVTVRASGDVAPVLERAGGARDGKLTIGFDPGQLSRLEPELGPRAAEQLGALLQARLPAAVRDRIPRVLVDRVAAQVVEEAIDYSYRVLHRTLLPRLRERTRIEVELPDVPIARVALASSPTALSLDVFTTLPVREGVGEAPPETDAIGLQLAGGTATEAANWGIASGVLPGRYTRSLKPAPDGAYVPHFEWRAGDPERPLVVHMFRVSGGCAHFAVGVQPRVEVRGDDVHAWIENRKLEQADGPLALELLARTKALVQASTSSKKKGPGSLRLTVGGREVTSRLVRAEVRGNELQLALAIAIAPPAAAAPPVAAATPAPQPRPDRARCDSAPDRTPQRAAGRNEPSAARRGSAPAARLDVGGCIDSTRSWVSRSWPPRWRAVCRTGAATSTAACSAASSSTATVSRSTSATPGSPMAR